MPEAQSDQPVSRDELTEDLETTEQEAEEVKGGTAKFAPNHFIF